MEKIKVIVEWTDNNFSAGVGGINGVVISTGNTIEDLKREFKSAFQFHIEESIKDGDKLPDYIISGNYELKFQLGASAMLHLSDGLISRSAIARVTGINEKQLSHYLTGKKVAREKQSKRISSGIKEISHQLDALRSIV